MMEQKTCFILMPFSGTESLNNEDLDYIYAHIIQKAVLEFEHEGVKPFLQVNRYEKKVGSIISGIVNQLNSADLVIADLTGLNPNVMYELGVRHSLRSGTIILTQEISSVPSDLRDFFVVEYEYSPTSTTKQVKLYEHFKSNLHQAIKEVIASERYDSPVLAYLNQRRLFEDEEGREWLVELIIIYKSLARLSQEIDSIISQLIEMNFEGIHLQTNYQLINLKLNKVSDAVSQLDIPYSSSDLFERYSNTKMILSEFGKAFGFGEYFDSFLSSFQEYGVPPIFGKRDLRSSVEHIVINLFTLSESGKLQGLTIQDLFKNEGVLKSEFLDFVEEFIETKAKELGVSDEELSRMATEL